MIRINLLGVERQKARKPVVFDAARQVSLACTLILLAAAGGIGWWYWSLAQESARLDGEIAAARQETERLRSLLAEVQQFEARRGQLQQRVSLIEQLRSGQSVPVQLLDHVSRSLPDMLWLTELRRDGATVTIEGRSTTLIALSDFVANLGDSPLVQKPIELISSQVEASAGSAGGDGQEVIRFAVRAQLGATPAPAQPPAPQ